MFKASIPFLFAVTLFGCTPSEKDAQTIVNRAIDTHGCASFEDLSFEFDFRDKHYSVSRSGEQVIYTRSYVDSVGVILDSLVDSQSFSRSIDNEQVDISEEWSGKYANSVNSVLYFFQLPCLLNDPAVYKSYQGTAIIKDQKYDLVKVTFNPEGGGEDFEDTYMYWFSQESGTMDYLAYNYQVEGGGTRFRVAINRRDISDLMVQDYVNYKAEEKFPPLQELPQLWEDGKLTKLSEIINEHTMVLD